ncbi:MAG: putative sulfate exporter family transporter [Candidatus Methanoperedens sp.]
MSNLNINKIVNHLPGIALLFIVGYIGKLLEPVLTGLTGVKIEYVLIAIIIGLLIRNLIKIPEIFNPGIDTYELWLKIGIVLLGARFVLQDIFKLGGISLALIIGEVFFATAIMILLGRYFKLSEKLTTLLAVGSSICGVSAIIAARGAIGANNRDTAYAIAAILGLGAAGLFIYPAIGHALNLSDNAAGIWLGISVDNTAEAVAAGGIFSEEAMRVSTLAKTMRNALIGFVVLAWAMYYASRGAAKEITNKGQFLWDKFPKFVLGFFAFSILSTLAVFGKGDITSLKNLYQWFFLLTFAGVGLRTSISEMRQVGMRPFVCGAIAEVAVTVFNLIIVYAAFIYLGL